MQEGVKQTLCSPASTGPLSALSGFAAYPVTSRGRTQRARVWIALFSWCVADMLSSATWTSTSDGNQIAANGGNID